MPLFPAPNFILRAPAEPTGTFASEGSEPIARDFAYADRDPNREGKPSDEDKAEQKPKVRPLPIFDKWGNMTNGEDYFQWEYRPYIPPDSPSKGDEIVPTPIMTPNGSFVHPEGGQLAEGVRGDGGRLSSAHLEFSRALEKFAEEQDHQEIGEHEGYSASIRNNLHPAFGLSSPLSSIASSSILSTLSQVHDDPQGSGFVDTGSTSADRMVENEAETQQRYSLRNRASSTQISRPSGSRFARSQHPTTTTSPSTSRSKENSRSGTPAGPGPEHPHHPSRRPAVVKQHDPASLKRRLEDEGSSASLNYTTAAPDTVSSSTDRRTDSTIEDNGPRMTRSRARKLRRLGGED